MQTSYNIHTLEDNYNYIEVDILEENNSKYLLLAQDINPSNICIRKIILKEDGEYYDKLSSKEFDQIYEKFIEKNKNLFE